MARTKQTARMSTGGKRPRQDVAVRRTTAFCKMAASRAALEVMMIQSQEGFGVPYEISLMIAKIVKNSSQDQKWTELYKMADATARSMLSFTPSKDLMAALNQIDQRVVGEPILLENWTLQ